MVKVMRSVVRGPLESYVAGFAKALFSMIFIGRSLRRRTAASLWAWKGRYRPEWCRLRRNSRLIVDAARPSSRPIAVGASPRLARSAILTRSSSDRNRGERSSLTDSERLQRWHDEHGAIRPAHPRAVLPPLPGGT